MDLTIDHIADFYCRYPGESVTFYTRLEAVKKLPGFSLRISLPAEVAVEDYRAPAGYGHALPYLEMGAGVNYLTWKVEEETPAGTVYEYQTRIIIPPTAVDTVMESRATVVAGSGKARVTAEEMVSIAVAAKGGYLKYLPAIYQADDMMGRFLMLFESFWSPIEQQIEMMPFYFDPQMTTSDVLPWLASWIGLVLDENWPEERRRLLLLSAASLYRRRGTRQGLQDYLEIYTGVKAKIAEQRAENFGLGAGARLGPGIALGKQNRPHTFTVSLSLPPIEAPTAAERKRQELVRRRIIEGIIEAEKPAHTSYTLELENLT
jgi:phage tail-like protein